MKYRVLPGFEGLRVCTADYVIDLTKDVKQKDLEYLYRRGYEGVAKVDKKEVKGEVETGGE